MTRHYFLRITLLKFFFIYLFQVSLSAQNIAINEVMASNATDITDEDGDHSDWVELYNYSASSVDLTGYGLSDDYSLPFKWVFPGVVIGPNQFLLVWASGKNRASPGQPLHSNFNISASGEEIILTHPDGTLVDELAPVAIPADLSYGRLPNGTGNWVYYSETTPNAPNSNVVTDGPLEPPTFSVPSGFYSSGFTLTLSHPDPEATIVYSLDGSEPLMENQSGVTYSYKNQYPQNPGQAFGPFLVNTYTSSTYTAPLQISDRSSQANRLANISSTWHFDPDYFPSQPIKKATVVRARAVRNGSSSDIVTHTYFVSSSSAFSSSLPIVSLSLNEDDLFDYHDGIYVAGVDFDNWRTNNPNGVTTGHVPANYRRRGIETEKPASFQYFVDGTEVLNQNIGLRLHGGFSKLAQNKSFRLYARAEYDDQNRFDYPFFGSGNSSSFKRLILRNSGNDAGNVWIGNAQVPTISPAVYFRDALIHKMVSHLRMDTQDYIPTLTYVNGEYWGLLNLRERYDHHYFERKYGIQETEVDYLGGNAEIVEGDDIHYLMMRDYISSNNLAIKDTYEHVKTLMDTDNFMDYQITQIYARNTDWPANNIEYFRKRTAQYEPDAPFGQDGRWRWLLFDTDHGFGWTGGDSYTHNSLQNAIGDNWARVILKKLLENQEFRNGFINRYADLLNTAFKPERLSSLIDGIAAKIASEIPTHRERWNTLPNWETNVQLMHTFAENRPAHARSHIRGVFGIGSEVKATIDVSDASHGHVQINTIEIKEETPGVLANPYPWEGIYFQNIPLSIVAIPKQGYAFSHWSGASSSTQAKIELNPTGDFTLQAHFVPLQNDDLTILYFWLMDDRIENDLPLVSLEATYSLDGRSASLDFSSVFGADYPFTEGHPNWRRGSMERRTAPTPINYHPKTNNGLGFEEIEMRGLQVKQPFLGNATENTLFLTFSTIDYNDIVLSFAALDEGAAKELKIEYYDQAANRWTDTNIINPTVSLTSEYQLYKINFSQVSLAQNNPSFNIRLRFAGVDMARDDGNRVTFNNIAIEGVQGVPTHIEDPEHPNKKMISIYPNPTENSLQIQTEVLIDGTPYHIYNMMGKKALSGRVQGKNTNVELGILPPGVYVLNVGDTMEHTFKVIKK